MVKTSKKKKSFILMEKTLKNMWLSPPYTTYNNRNLTLWCLQVLLSVSGQRQTLFKMPPAHPYPHCEGLYKYTWLEMHIAALIWYAKHWPHPCIVLHEALRTAAAGPSVIRLLKRGHWDPTSHYSQRHRLKTSIETENAGQSVCGPKWFSVYSRWVL